MTQFSHMIFYVKDISRALNFYKEAFGIKSKFVHESGAYAELETGETALAFAVEELGDANLPSGYQKSDLEKKPLGCEITFTVEDVEKVYDQALNKGGVAVSPPKQKPWGQLVAYLRDPNGVLIELGSPIKT